MSFFETTHPKNGFDITVEYDEDFRLVSASYGDGEDVDLTMPSVKSAIQADIDQYVKD